MNVCARVARLARSLATRWRLRRCAFVGEGARALGPIDVHGGGEIRIGAHVTLDSSRIPIELHAARGATIVIEDDVYVGGGTSIEARSSVRIGARTRLAELCKVMDNNFHRARGDRTSLPASTPISIASDAVIGARAIVLPGARIGERAVVTSASVVTRVVPAGRVATGVPAVVRRA